MTDDSDETNLDIDELYHDALLLKNVRGWFRLSDPQSVVLHLEYDLHAGTEQRSQTFEMSPQLAVKLIDLLEKIVRQRPEEPMNR